jgi:DNA-binding MarR family transcriptional regulator
MPSSKPSDEADQAVLPLRDRTDDLIIGWAQERPDLDVSPLGVINRLGLLLSFLRPEIAAVLERFDLSMPSFSVLATLRRAGTPYQLSQRALMDKLQLTSGTISVRIDRLERDDLVERLPDPDDQRGVLVHLTEKGLKRFDQVAPVHMANEDRLLSALTRTQRDQLAALLRTLLLSFEQPSSDDPRHLEHWLGADLAPAHVALQIRRLAGLAAMPGLLVQHIAEASLAAQAGLKEGDLIITAGGEACQSIETFYHHVLAAEEETLALEIVRGTTRQPIQLPVNHAASDQ